MSISSLDTMILAAGLGKRMLPLTKNFPKPLLSVGNKPLLQYLIEGVQAYGSPNIIVNTYHAQEILCTWIANHYPQVILSKEDKLLETGGGIQKALPLFSTNPFFVINGDLFIHNAQQVLPLCFRMLEQIWNHETMDALLVLISPECIQGLKPQMGDFSLTHPSSFGPIVRDSSRTAYIFSGIQLLSQHAFRLNYPAIFSNNFVWDEALSQKRLWGMVYPLQWFHVSTPEALQDIHNRISTFSGHGNLSLKG